MPTQSVDAADMHFVVTSTKRIICPDDLLDIEATTQAQVAITIGQAQILVDDIETECTGDLDRQSWTCHIEVIQVLNDDMETVRACMGYLFGRDWIECGFADDWYPDGSFVSNN
jgi:hypothetical protein